MIGWLLRRVFRALFLLLGAPLWLPRAFADRLGRRDVLSLRLSDRLPDLPDAQPAWRRLVRKAPRTSLLELLLALDEAREDRRIRAVLITLDRSELSLVQAEELLEAIDRAKAAGKKVLCWADGLTGPALVLGAAADRLLGAPESQVEFLGVRVRAVFLHDLLETLGVSPQLERHGDYKSMADMFQARGMTPAHEEMARDLGGGLYEQVLTPLLLGRGLERADAVATLDDAPVSTATAVERRLIDRVAYRDELPAAAGELAGAGEQPAVLAPARLLARRARRQRLVGVVRDLRRIRLIGLQGTIVAGERGRGCPSRPTVRALDAAREDPRVGAVVLRIDSPGGSATASDEIWRAVRRLDEAKPVVASLASVAASGGYYIAVGARRILASSATLTGSIGVVSGKLHLQPALFRWGLKVEGPSFGARAGLYDPDRPFTPAERAAVRRELMRFYRTFLERVAAGRRMSVDAVDAVAQGRVYTGRRAHGLGLVDQLGGVGAAIASAAELAGLPVYRTEVVLPFRRGLAALFEQEGEAPDAAGPLAQLAVAAGAELSASLGPPLADLLCLSRLAAREPVLAYCPWTVQGL